MSNDTDQPDDRTAENPQAAIAPLPRHRPRRRLRGDKGGPLRNHRTGRPREGLALERHRNGAHRNLKQTVVCEIPSPLPVGGRELEVFAAILSDSIRMLFADPD
jgi:hypothetical protein